MCLSYSCLGGRSLCRVSQRQLSNYYPLFLRRLFSLFIEHTTTTTNIRHALLQFRLDMLSDLGFDHICLVLTFSKSSII